MVPLLDPPPLLRRLAAAREAGGWSELVLQRQGDAPPLLVAHTPEGRLLAARLGTIPRDRTRDALTPAIEAIAKAADDLEAFDSLAALPGIGIIATHRQPTSHPDLRAYAPLPGRSTAPTGAEALLAWTAEDAPQALAADSGHQRLLATGIHPDLPRLIEAAGGRLSRQRLPTGWAFLRTRGQAWQHAAFVSA